MLLSLLLIGAVAACSGATDDASSTGDATTPGNGSGTSDPPGNDTRPSGLPTELPPGTSAVVINEVTSSGDDEIELYNQSGEPVDISGWWIIDDNPENERFVFREGTVIAPGRFIVLVKGDDHQFGLGREDEVNLYDATGRLVDATAWPRDAAEVSWCRLPDGTGPFQSCAEQTFGALNASVDQPVCGDNEATGDEVCDGTDLRGRTCGDFGFASGTLACEADCRGFDLSGCASPVLPDCGDSPCVVINEVTSTDDDEIELYNQSPEAIDLSGWWIIDDNPENPRYVFPAGTRIEAGEFMVLVKGIHHEFGLGREDEVNLYNAGDVLVDATAWPRDAAAISWCRLPDGTGAFQSCAEQTFGAANVTAAGGFCGDGEAAGDEVCDGDDLRGTTCADLGWETGSLACAEDCMAFDTSGCSMPAAPSCEGDFCVVINEVTSSDEDFVEFLNIGDEAVDLSGWWFIDDNPQDNEPYVFSDGTVLLPGMYLVREKDVHHTFGLGRQDEVNLYNASGQLIDATAWPRDGAAVSWCRIPNGVGVFQSCSTQTFGAPNEE